MLDSITSVSLKKSVIRNEILKLLINRNTRFTHIYINIKFGIHQLHLIPGAEDCFSELKFLLYEDPYSNNKNVLEGFTGISKSIKKLDLRSNITKIINLIGVQKMSDFAIFALYICQMKHSTKHSKNH